jgi:adenosylcobinamide kinase/adenosylcobinamide-phosphate guanylyltransferase
MSESLFILGGCRSGKSSFALERAELHGSPRVFIATLERTGDSEMEQRVRMHREARGPEWETVEEPLQIAQAIDSRAGSSGVILVDCLTLWLSNMLCRETGADEIDAKGDELCNAVEACSCPVILVSNEVGTGIVPERKLGRDFRDLAGWLNQKTARACGTVAVMHAGIPSIIKGDLK